jgi:hypothetical protein
VYLEEEEEITYTLRGIRFSHNTSNESMMSILAAN